MNNNNDESEASSSPQTLPAFAPDQKLAGVFVLRRELTSDGAERVWLAHDEVLGKDVSLHFIPQALRSDDRSMTELRHEIKRNRQLIHPGILRVYDLIEEPEWAAISMDWFEGETLATRLSQQGPAGFQPKEIESWVRQICQTLDDVHRIQIVHRHLAPKNLIVDAAGKVLIAKFGVSRVIEDALGRMQRTPGGERHLAYLSPQQLDGESPNKLDDIYALGATIFELLSGKAPFSGADMLAQVRRVAPPSIGETRGDKGAIPASWEKAVAACLAKSPTERPQTAGEVAGRLDLASTKASSAAATGAAAAAAAAAVAVTTASRPEKKPLRSAPPAVPPAPEEALTPRSAPSRSTAAEEPELAPSGSDPEIYPDLYPKSSGSNTGVVLVAALVLLAGAVFYFGWRENRKSEQALTAVESTPAPMATPAKITESPAKLEPVTPKTDLAEGKPGAVSPPSGDLLLGEPSLTDKPSGNVTVLPAGAVSGAAPTLAANTAPASTPQVITAPASTPSKTAMPPASTASVSSPATSRPGGGSAAAEMPSIAVTGIPGAVPMAKPESVEQAKQMQAAAEKAYQEAIKKQQSAEAAMAASQKGIDDKMKSSAAVIKAAEELQAQRQKQEETVKGAETAAREAHQAAEEKKKEAELKARQLEEAQKSLADWDNQSKPKIAARDQAQIELDALKKALEEKKTTAAESARAVATAEAARAQLAGAVKAAEEEAKQARLAAEKKAAEDAARAAEAAKAAEAARVAEAARAAEAARVAEAAKAAEAARIAAETARRADEERIAKKVKLQQQMEEMMQTFKKQMEELEKPGAAPAVPAAVPATPAPRASTPVPKASTPAPRSAAAAATPIAASAAKPVAQTSPGAADLPFPTGADPTEIPLSQLPPPSSGSGSLQPMPGQELASAKPPMPVPATGKTPSAGPDSGKSTVESSIGLKFAPVGDILMATYPVRVADFETFVKETSYKATGWRNPGFKQAPDHPVVNVSWNDAMAFCKWLTERDRKKGVLPKEQAYRLPTDLEWSKAVGLPEENGKTPEARDMGVADIFPWGTQWPPPSQAGNYTGEETGSDVAIKGYDDGFAWTSPVGSFPPNKFGLYDMGGNVWQWCMDDWNIDGKAKVLRGASWYNGALKLSLLSSCRVHAKPDSSTDNYGFRIVKATEPASGKKK